MLRLLVLLSLGWISITCTKFSKKVEEPVRKSKAKSEPREIDVPVASDANLPPASGAAPGDPATTVAPSTIQCDPFGKMPSAPPVGVGKPLFVVTRVLKKCTTADGRDGYEPSTPYLVMGFPCSGGGGEISIKGNSYDPKMVSFKMAIGCPMAPRDAASVSSILKKDFDVFENARLLAYTPFEIQYWEMEAFSDADVGGTIELRSSEALRKGWDVFQKKEPLKVRLLGRESSWIKGGQSLQADAKIFFESPKRFRVEIDRVTALSEDDFQAARQRCLALQPKRDCADAFSN